MAAMMASGSGSFRRASNENDTPNSMSKPQAGGAGRYYVSKYSTMNRVEGS